MSVLSSRIRGSVTTGTWVTYSNNYRLGGRKNTQQSLAKAKGSAYCRTLSSSNNDDDNNNNPNANNKQQSATKEVSSAANNTTTSSSSQKSNSQTQRFYLLDVSPYLDPLAFCRSSASYEYLARKHTIDGTLAARRLNRGKQMVRDFIKYQLCSYFHLPDRKKSKQPQQQQVISNEQYILANLRAQHGSKRWRTPFQKPKNKHPQPFILSGHGIPKQLLQDHLQLCQQVILHLQEQQIMTGKECFFHHSCTAASSHNNSLGTTATVGNSDVILHVRNKGYKNQVIPWPLPPTTREDSITNLFQDRFVLYVTVMNRLSTTLVQMLTSPNDNRRAPAQEYWHQQNLPSYWNVHFCIRDCNSGEPNDYFHYINDHNNLNSLSSQPLTMQLNNDKQPIIVAQLSERATSCGMKASTVTNVRIQMHGMVPKTADGFFVDEASLNMYTSNTVDIPNRVSMFYEACFYSNK